VKKEASGLLPCGHLELRRPKEAAVHHPALPPPTKQWWEMELEAHAAYCGPDDPEDAPGQHLLLGRSANEDYRQVAYIAQEVELWSAKDSGNFIDLATAAPSPPLTPKEEEENSDFSDNGDNFLQYMFTKNSQYPILQQV
jgi:hypothetical protein